MILVSVALGVVLSPHKAFSVNFGSKRLGDAIWPIPATQVAHYMAELTGLTILLWTGDRPPPSGAARHHPGLAAALLATHTRTALIGMVIGLVVARSEPVHRQPPGPQGSGGDRHRARGGGPAPRPGRSSGWLIRGQKTAQFSNLSGRTTVWPLVLSEPRPVTNKILGSGLSNGSVIGQGARLVNGLPIDSSWVATYQDQGIVGDMLEAVMFLVLLGAALLRPRGPARALALFLILYCLFASFTETGMGEASTYLLDLTVAASLLVFPSTRPRPPSRPGIQLGATVQPGSP